MKKYFTYINLIIIVFFFFISCKKENRKDCIKSRGEDMVIKYNPQNKIKKIELYDLIDLQLTDTIKDNSIYLKSGENIIENISINFTNNRLLIEDNNTCNWVRTYNQPSTIFLNPYYYKEIESYGGGNIYTTQKITTDTLGIGGYSGAEIEIEVDATYLGFIITESTQLKLKGESQMTAGICYRYANLNSLELSTSKIYLQHESYADCYIQGKDTLHLISRSPANVYYKTQSTIVTIEEKDKGKIIRY